MLSRRMPARIEVAVASAERGTYRAFFDQGSGYGPNRAFVNEIAYIKQGRAWPLLRRSGDEEKTVTTCEQGGHRVGCERSARECSPLLGLSFDDSLWLGRQLKNCSLLTLTENRQQHDLAVRKFDRIVMATFSLLVCRKIAIL